MKKSLLNLLCGVLLCWNITDAQVPGNPKLNVPAVVSLPVDKSPTKLSPELKKIAAQNNAPKIQSLSIQAKPAPAANDALDKYMQYRGNGVVVDVSVEGDGHGCKGDFEKNRLPVTGV